MYLEFFESKEHLKMKSFSLVPHNDNSLLIINSGMAPLKPYFTGHAGFVTVKPCNLLFRHSHFFRPDLISFIILAINGRIEPFRKPYGVNELRKMYLEFFESKEHLKMKSFSLVPHNKDRAFPDPYRLFPLKTPSST